MPEGGHIDRGAVDYLHEGVHVALLQPPLRVRAVEDPVGHDVAAQEVEHDFDGVGAALVRRELHAAQLVEEELPPASPYSWREVGCATEEGP